MPAAAMSTSRRESSCAGDEQLVPRTSRTSDFRPGGPAQLSPPARLSAASCFENHRAVRRSSNLVPAQAEARAGPDVQNLSRDDERKKFPDGFARVLDLADEAA